MNEMKVKGFVKRITFRNEDNGYTVLTLSDQNGKETCCVGTFSSISEGEYISVDGVVKEHPKYGKQVQVSSYEVKAPEDTLSMERYLGSGAIKGVGVALAARIVRKFGKDTFQVIEKEPERLAEVKGISQKMAISIVNQFNQKQVMRNAMLFLQDYNITMNLALKIYNKYKENVYDIMKNNPYRLAEDITGVGFQIADAIAKKAGFSWDSEFRIRAGIDYILQDAIAQGNCYLPEKETIVRAQKLLGVTPEQVQIQLDSLMFEKNIVCIEKENEQGNDRERLLYKTYMYQRELNCARMLVDLNIDFPSPIQEVKKRLKRIEKNGNITLDERQREAVMMAACNGVMIITGGPGTGKTTTINTIIQMLEEEDLEILLAAPTGRAAKRMSETTGKEAQTIHRLLELNRNSEEVDDAKMRFERNEENPLETDAIIIDEMSMVDIHLMNALLRAIVPGTRLIMVGDCNQLPSVGPGNVLKDMIEAKFCPVVRLEKIFRQAAESDIVMNAHKINEGRSIKMDNDSKDFFFLQRSSTQKVEERVLYLILQYAPKYINTDDIYDIQVLTPMRKGELGVDNLNVFLQKYMNPASPDKTEREFHGTLFREHDKIMQVKNDYQLTWKKENDFGDVAEEGTGVFNGDCGIIKRISDVAETVEIEFEEGKTVSYSFGNMDEVELAYAITIHKSQGSEYPAVVLPLLGGPKMLFNRNLLYTAVTRAKKCVFIVGEKNVVNEMIANNNEQMRYSSLVERIREVNGCV